MLDGNETSKKRRSFKRWCFKIAIIVLATLVILISTFLIWQATARAEIARNTSVPEAPGISSLEKVTLGGVDQAVLMRGHDKNAEVVLFVHGGPGLPNMPFSHLQSQLEEHFVVVQWDQRGAGKSFTESLDADSLNIAQYVSDTIELTDWLRERFEKERIFLLGHSWGSVIGLKSAAEYPDRFHGYFGVAQVTDVMAAQKLVYEATLERARERGIEEAVSELERMGPPPFARAEDHVAACRWLAELEERPPLFELQLAKEALRSPYYENADFVKLYRGAKLSVEKLWDPLSELELSKEIRAIEVPVVFIQGRNDALIPGELIENYENKLQAPAGKSLLWIDEAGHLPHLERPALFVESFFLGTERMKLSNP